MPRLRLGVAVLLPESITAEVNGLRRALGDGALGRIAPHITLVPPVNVRSDELPQALATLRAAAAEFDPFEVHLGPVSTFHPDTPVIKLDVGGPGLATLHALRDATFKPPLERSLTWPFVPHVTLADEASLTRIGHAVPALDRYGVDIEVKALHLLEEGSSRQWTPLADVDLGALTELGRGSLPMALHRSSLVDPVAKERLALPATPTTLVFTAERHGDLLGVVGGHQVGDHMVLEHWTVEPESRGFGVGSALMRTFLAECSSRNLREVELSTGLTGPAAVLNRFGFADGRLAI